MQGGNRPHLLPRQLVRMAKIIVLHNQFRALAGCRIGFAATSAKHRIDLILIE
jgi:hypothetical protein